MATEMDGKVVGGKKVDFEQNRATASEMVRLLDE